MRLQRIGRLSAPAVIVVAALLVSGCGGDDGDDSASPTTTAAGGAATTSAPPVTEPGPAGRVIEVTVSGGSVEGGGRQRVPLGEEVRLRVTSDVTDEVHVHGYERRVDVTAGQTAELDFVADLPGVFEVELENAGRRLVELEVRP